MLTRAIHGNPFALPQLAMINDSSVLLPQETSQKLRTLLELGEKQYRCFFYDRLIYQKVPISGPIRLNQINLWQSNEHTKYSQPDNRVLNKIRSAASNRSEQAKEVFGKELFGFPQSFSKNGTDLYHGSKSDMMKKFEAFVVDNLQNTTGKSTIIIDMAHIIHAKSFADVETFSDFAFALYFQIKSIAEAYERWDLCFDRYFEDSLKAATHKQRGSGSRYDFTENSPLPRKMQETFLTNSQNKDQLNMYLAKEIIKLHKGPQTLVVTYKDSILYLPSSPSVYLSSSPIGKCQSEDADQRVVRHAKQCFTDHADYENIFIRSGDTDVIILLVAHLAPLIHEGTNKETRG